MPKIIKYQIEMIDAEETELLWNLEKKELTGFYKLIKKIYDRGDLKKFAKAQNQEEKNE